VYNCPGRTGSLIAVDTVVRLSELEQVAALKDAVGDIDYTSEVASKCDIPILSGNDGMNWPIMAVGGVGCISVLANIAPRVVSDLIQAGLDGDCAKASQMHKRYFELCNSLFVESNPIPVKAAAEIMGMCGGEIREPLTPITDAGREVLKASMKKVGLL
jgi:4-hydroxy-tetrahydrodipicolinate synthase